MNEYPEPPPHGSPYEPPIGDPPPGDATSPGHGAPEPDKDARMMAMLAHLLGGATTIMLGGLGFVGPLIIWIVKKDDHPFIDDQGKEALNFQLNMLIAALIATVITIISCGVLFPIVFIPLVLQVVFSIIAGIKANEGVWYRYPLIYRLIT